MTRVPQPPTELKFWWPHAILKHDPTKHIRFINFIQHQVNRLIVGGFRYGPASSTQKYHERAMAELRAYRRTHNLQHLRDLANYCFLESEAPAFKDAYYDDTAPSATRRKFGTGGFVSK